MSSCSLPTGSSKSGGGRPARSMPRGARARQVGLPSPQPPPCPTSLPQAAAAAHRHTADPEQRRALAAYLRELQDDVVQSGFFAGVAEARGGGDV